VLDRARGRTKTGPEFRHFDDLWIPEWTSPEGLREPSVIELPEVPSLRSLVPHFTGRVAQEASPSQGRTKLSCFVAWRPNRCCWCTPCPCIRSVSATSHFLLEHQQIKEPTKPGGSFIHLFLLHAGRNATGSDSNSVRLINGEVDRRICK
jgi:hypothetical protein